MKIPFYNIKGEKLKPISLSAEIFGAKINKHLMAQAVRVYLANQRKSKAKAKTRAQVAGSGKKIWRQKGTGRARHRDRQAPIFVGGGKAHGPTGKENWQLKMSKKMKKLSLFSALTVKLKEKALLGIKDLGKIKPKTKEMVKIMQKLKMKNDKSKSKILLILPEKNENIMRAGRNIQGLSLVLAHQLNTYEVLKHQRIIFTKESLAIMQKIFLKKQET